LPTLINTEEVHLDSIIVDRTLLSENYVPDRLEAREGQTEQVLCCLSPLLKKQKPIHAWLHGKPGTGKTATAINALRCLEEKAHVESVIVNCWEKRSYYGILDEIISQLKILRAEEHRTSFKLEKLRSYLKDCPLVVLLDEIDQVNPRELSTVLYNLHSILNAGLVCISNSAQPILELEERVRSRLNPHTIPFPKYSLQNLLEILKYRAERALAEGSWSETALKQIARMAQGDARAAIRMLQRAAILASQQQINKIATARLAEQIRSAHEMKKACLLDNLTQDHRILYQIVKQKGRILSGDLWQKYLEHCTRIKRKPLASRTFSDHANRLVQAGLVTAERARVKGKVRLFRPVK
jgi:orc1/cdc6 family replication initiation protein